jgi:ferredoxin-NADP reductase
MALAMDLRVARRTEAADGVLALTLVHPAGRRLPDWTPGSHLDLVLPGGLTRQYSLCGDRWDAYSYRLGVLREPAGRGGSAFVHDELREGAAVAIGGPRNNFRLVPSERYLFVAGGIGITPLLPMVRQAEMLGADWRLLYGGRTRASMAFLDELEPYGGKVVVVPQDEHGPLDLPAWLPEPADPGLKVYCCGPGPLLDAVERRCSGWPPGLLRTERPYRDGRARTVGARRGGRGGGQRAVVVPPGAVRHVRDRRAGRRARPPRLHPRRRRARGRRLHVRVRVPFPFRTPRPGPVRGPQIESDTDEHPGAAVHRHRPVRP